ncbi:MAG: phosphoglycerate kinase [Bacteroides stercoris]
MAVLSSVLTLGRPKGATDKFSLKHILKHLSELLGVEVLVRPRLRRAKKLPLRAAASSNGCEVLLLENLRFYAEEEGKPRGFGRRCDRRRKEPPKLAVKESQKEFTKKLASYAGCYTSNDAFRYRSPCTRFTGRH